MVADVANGLVPRADHGILPAGTVLGRYEVLCRIASGGMATVYQARTRGAAGFERLVAIKCCHPHLRAEPEFAAMFLDEARLAAGIHHPNVVATLDVADDALLYLVMDYVEGDSLGALLAAAIRTGSGLPAGVALRVMADALTGLHAAHTLCDEAGKPLGIVHRDVSPQNVLVGTDGVTRLTDFGVARAEARLAQTRPGELKGKLGYMPPEQISRHEVTVRGDVYSAGVVLWEALTGYRLFGDRTGGRTADGLVERPSALATDLPRTLDEVVLRALDPEPSRRYASAADFVDALEACGVAMASPRTVGELIERLLPGPLAQRRAARRAIGVLAGPDPRAPESDTHAAPVAVVAVDPSRVRSRGSLGVTVAVALAAGALGALVAVRSMGHGAAVAHAPAPVPAVVAEPVQIAPIVAEPVQRAPVAAPAVVAQSPVAAPSVRAHPAMMRPSHHAHPATGHHHAPARRAGVHSVAPGEYDPGAV